MTEVDALIRRQLGAADPTASVWVTASAGTGKTHVLTDRVLRLMLAGSPPERLLCLTFTKAAAAEMANRIHERLGGWTRMDDAELSEDLARLTGRPAEVQDITRARRLFAQVLETPGGLKVQTIHAFCESLLGRFPLEAGLPPHFQVADERTADELLAWSRDRVLADDAERPEPAAREITALVDEASFAELMRALSSERGRLSRLLAQHESVDGLVRVVRRCLGVGDGVTERSLLEAAAAEVAFDGPSLRRVADALCRGSKRDQARGARIAAWLAAPDQRVDSFDAYCGAFFKASDGAPFADLIHKEALSLAPDGAALLQAECARLAAVNDLRKAVRIAEATAALVALAARLNAAYDEAKRRHALLDYDDLILATRDLLQRPGVAPWVLYKLDGGLDQILIDEAQDTNPDQWRVVQALAEEFFAGEGGREVDRTIFAVGDPKQSIFSFQRADPDAFSTMRAYFEGRVKAAQQNWRPIELALSFRSTPAILTAVDQIFADPAAQDGLLFPSGEVRHFAERRGDAGLVEFWPTETPTEVPEEAPWSPPLKQAPDDDPMARLARRIADTIAAWFATGELLVSAGRPIEPGDIMILVQRRAPFLEEMVRQLKQRGIPVAGVDRMVLSEQIAVMDLLALGRFLLFPDDDLNLAVVLKSPLIGFDEAALFELAYERNQRLWATLARRRDENERFRRAHERLFRWRGRIDFDAPFEFFASLLGVEGGRRRLLHRLGVEANDAIDEFLSLALEYERSHAPSLQGFLHWLEAGHVEVKRDQDERRDEVRVLTVHGAKGLQAPVVFLADTVRMPRQLPALLWHQGDDGETVPLWLPRSEMAEPVTQTARETARRRRDQEYRRLFYVALTRARDRLYITGWEGKRGRSAGCWYDLAATALAEIGELISLPDGRTGLWVRNAQLRPVTSTDGSPPGAEAGPLPAWATAPAPAELRPSRPLSPSRPELADPPVRRPLGADAGAGFHRGNLVHRLLQALPELPAGQRESAARRYLASPAHGLDAAAQDEILGETLAVLSDPTFARMFGSGSRAEVPIVGVVGDRIIAGQVDRLLVAHDEVLIVDYKSNRSAPAEVEDVDAAYLGQMAAYAQVLQGVFPDRPIRCALLWTTEPCLMVLPEGLLAQHVP